ncbi:MAG TPA: phosphatase PAP2 family protein [Phaeodactylibacter sp.]|nr:phosphatase PAP2 family protein [Phaeodactylibacter sp.]
MWSIRNVVAVALLFVLGHVSGQEDSLSLRLVKQPVYKVNPWLSGSIGLIGAYTNIRGIPKVKDKPKLSLEELGRITSQGVGWLNRAGLRQDPQRREQAHRISDALMYGTASLPFLLVLDKTVKPAFWDISLMYIETVSITSNLYTYSPLGPTFIDRYRPLAFYEDINLAERRSGNQRNSFYSGHVATTAMGAFFMAKVLHDYHPEWGNKRMWLFAGAAVPTAVVGVLRLRALKHFPTDLVAGGLIGAGMGVLIPELHRRWQNRVRLRASLLNDQKAVGLHIRF